MGYLDNTAAPPPWGAPDSLPVVRLYDFLHVDNLQTMKQLLYGLTVDSSTLWMYEIKGQVVRELINEAQSLAEAPVMLEFSAIYDTRTDIALEIRAATLLEWIYLRRLILEMVRVEDRGILGRYVVDRLGTEIAAIRNEMPRFFTTLKVPQQIYLKYLCEYMDKWWLQYRGYARIQNFLGPYNGYEAIQNNLYVGM